MFGLTDVVVEDKIRRSQSIKKEIRDSVKFEEKNKKEHLSKLLKAAWIELRSDASYFVSIASLSLL